MNGAGGRLYAGTSGFAYPGWVPLFYPAGTAGQRFLQEYAARLPAVELHTTFYRRPGPATVSRWVSETPTGFRFCPKAQRGAAARIWSADASVAAASVSWLTGALVGFGERLGPVLLSAPGRLMRDDAALARVIAAWPASLALALELPHPSWADDAVHAQLTAHGVALVATDRDEADEPDLRRFGRILYVRFRRSSYSEGDIARWADRLVPFIADGVDVYAFFRHDEEGRSGRDAEALLSRTCDLVGADREAGASA